MTRAAARLAALWRSLLPPRRTPVAIIDAEGADDLLPYLRDGAATIVDLRRSHLNAWVLARTLLRGRRTMLDYASAYLRAVRPSVVLTMIDTTPLFYKLKELWPSATYVSVQNGWRAWEFVRDFPAGSGPYKADYILCFGEAASRLYSENIDARTLVIGSLRNNAVPRSTTTSSTRTVALISTLRDKVDLDGWMPGYGDSPVIQYREVFARRLTLASWVSKFCLQHGIHLRIVGKEAAPSREFELYRELLGDEGDAWSFAPRRGRYGSYEEVARARIVVTTSSTLGYEALALGKRTAFFLLEAELRGLDDYRFGWPLDYPVDGDIWVNRLDRDHTIRILDGLMRIDDVAWARRVAELVPRVIDHDPGNTRLRSLLGSLGVGRP